MIFWANTGRTGSGEAGRSIDPAAVAMGDHEFCARNAKWQECAQSVSSGRFRGPRCALPRPPRWNRNADQRTAAGTGAWPVLLATGR